jgi:hypothetical protein
VFSIVLAKMHIRCHNNWKFNGYLEEDRLHEVAIPHTCKCSPLTHRPSRLIDGTWTTALAGAAQRIALIVAVSRWVREKPLVFSRRCGPGQVMRYLLFAYSINTHTRTHVHTRARMCACGVSLRRRQSFTKAAPSHASCRRLYPSLETKLWAFVPQFRLEFKF